MLKKLFQIGGIILALNLNLFAQNPVRILAPKYVNFSVNPPQTSNLPIPTTTTSPHTSEPNYAGQRALVSQNIIVDNSPQKKIIFFVIDGKFYDNKGYHFATMMNTIYSGQPAPLTGANPSQIADGYSGEFVIIPDDKRCGEFHILSSTYQTSGQSHTAFPVYAKLRVQYNGAGNLIPTIYDSNYEPIGGSGLKLLSVPYYPNFAELVQLPNLMGAANYNVGGEATTNGHSSYPLFGVAQKYDDAYPVFMANQSRVMRMKVDPSGISYSGYAVELFNLQPSAGQYTFGPITSSDRVEMELATIQDLSRSTGFKNRIAWPINYQQLPTQTKPSALYYGIAVLDFDLDGTYIPNSFRMLTYNRTSGSNSDNIVHGIEFSPDGSKLYATHLPVTGNSTGFNYPVAIDYFDLNQPGFQIYPTPLNIASNIAAEFQKSQIEVSMTGTLLLAANNRIAQISNANSNSPIFTNQIVALQNYTPTKPSQTPNLDSYYLRAMQDQNDQMNYSSISFPQINGINFNAATTNDLVWTPNTPGSTTGNPLTTTTSSVIYIENELRIPAGKSITIQNMTFRFGPNARLIIENSTNPAIQGGKLELVNCLLTAGTTCGAFEMWRGVEVWGTPNAAQASFANASQQGKLLMKNGSRIEHARYGAAAWRTNPSNNAPQGSQGGIIMCENSTFSNNQHDVVLSSYTHSSNVDNFSYFKNTVFETTSFLLEPNYEVQYHLGLIGVKGVKIQNCRFQNTMSNVALDKLGVGIFADRSVFASTLQTRFTNLTNGIRTISYSNQAYTVQDNSFFDCVIGIRSFGAKNNRIFKNSFYVKQFTPSSSLPFSQSSGISLLNCTGYNIEGNAFDVFGAVQNSSTNTYGIVISTSGGAHNEVYRNTFANLKFGAQAEGFNASDFAQSPSGEGLKWKCNTFSNINSHDLLTMKGRVSFYQGNTGNTVSLTNAQMNSSNNKFSLNNEGMPAMHDFYQSSGSRALVYRYPNTVNYIPDSYTNNNLPNFNTSGDINIQQTTFYGNPIQYNAAGCPTKFGKFIVGGINLVPGILLPFPLPIPQPITNLVDDLNDLKYQISITNSTHPTYQSLVESYDVLAYQLTGLFNDQLNYYKTDSTITNSRDSIIAFLSQIDFEEFKIQLLDEYISIGDAQSAQDLLSTMNVTNSRIRLTEILLDAYDKNLDEFLATSPNDVARLQWIVEMNEDEVVKNIAQSMLNYRVNQVGAFDHYFITDENTRSSVFNEETAIQQTTQFSLYPNPASESVRLVSKSNEKANYTLRVMNVVGQVVHEDEMNRNEKFINVSAFENGIYIIQIQDVSGSIIESIKFLKN